MSPDITVDRSDSDLMTALSSDPIEKIAAAPEAQAALNVNTGFRERHLCEALDSKPT